MLELISKASTLNSDLLQIAFENYASETVILAIIAKIQDKESLSELVKKAKEKGYSNIVTDKLEGEPV